MPILELHNIYYHYDDTIPALQDVSLSIKKGEKIAVLGNNGAGKTTFFMVCNGILKPHSGTLTHNEQTLKYKKNELLALRKDVGLIFQDADNQLIAPTVEGEVSFGLLNLGMEEDEVCTEVNKILDELNLINFRERPPHYLSGGEKKRVSIADVLVMNPKIILLDEPTASLDPVNCDILELLLADLHEKDIALVIATHDVDFAWRWADRVLVFHNGRVIADGEPELIFGNTDIITKANLKKPQLFEIYDMMVQTFPDLLSEARPKNADDFRRLMRQIQTQ